MPNGTFLAMHQNGFLAIHRPRRSSATVEVRRQATSILFLERSLRLVFVIYFFLCGYFNILLIVPPQELKHEIEL